MGARQIQIFSDSQLVVHQVNQNFTAKDVSMTAYLQHTRHLLTTFNAYLISRCRRFANIPQLPTEPLTAMVSPRPFAQWGLDLIGPMPEGKGRSSMRS
ncbi:unnamed protein product [Prunus brigantina]